MRIPDEIIKKLITFCEENEIGLAALYNTDGISVIVAGPRTFTPDQIGIIAANMLLTGIITGGITASNDDKEKTEATKKEFDATIN